MSSSRRAVALRFIPLAVSAGLLVISAYVFFVSHHWRSQFHTIEQAEPARLIVDFSRTDEYTGPLVQKYALGHDEGVELVVSPEVDSYEDACTVLQGLRGQVLIKDAAGSPVFEGPLGPLNNRRYEEGVIPLARFSPFPAGSYTLSIHVDEPAKSLAGRPQQVVAKHWLCGCEGLMAADYAFVLGSGLLVIAIVSGLIGIFPRRPGRESTQDAAGILHHR